MSRCSGRDSGQPASIGGGEVVEEGGADMAARCPSRTGYRRRGATPEPPAARHTRRPPGRGSQPPGAAAEATPARVRASKGSPRAGGCTPRARPVPPGMPGSRRARDGRSPVRHTAMVLPRVARPTAFSVSGAGAQRQGFAGKERSRRFADRRRVVRCGYMPRIGRQGGIWCAQAAPRGATDRKQLPP